MLEITQEPAERTTLQLSPQEGELIRSLIVTTSGMAFNRYVERMGLQATNVVNYLSGRNRISVSILAKLLAGTNLQLQCQLQVTITSGNDVVDVDSTPLEEMLSSHELDTVEMEDYSTRPLPLPPTPESSLSEKPPSPKTITLDSLSKEIVEEFCTQFLDTLKPPLPTTLPTHSDVDQQPKTTEEASSTDPLSPQR